MKIIETKIPEVKVIEPNLFKDERGFFFESFNKTRFNEMCNCNYDFVQDNHSKSTKGVLRGLHFQEDPHAQGKLVRVIKGEIFDVAVDIRKSSNTFATWVGEFLSESNKKQLWIPPGFAHGFLTLSENAEVLYKTTDFYYKDLDRGILWSDPTIGIKWPFIENIFLSHKDKNAKTL